MTVEIKWDQIQSSQIRHSGDGLEITRGITVTGVDTNSINAACTIIDAMNVSGMPQLGEDYPNQTVSGGLSLLKLVDRQLRAFTPNGFKVDLVYRAVQASIEIGSSLMQVQTNKDFQGNLIKATYGEGEANQQVATVNKLIPCTTLSITRLEFICPASKSQTYAGTINSSEWSLVDHALGGNINFNGGAKKWICTGIPSRSKDTGYSWEVRYQFQYNPYGWDEEYCYVDVSTNRPPDDVTVQVVQIYGETNFNTLGLP